MTQVAFVAYPGALRAEHGRGPYEVLRNLPPRAQVRFRVSSGAGARPRVAERCAQRRSAIPVAASGCAPGRLCLKREACPAGLDRPLAGRTAGREAHRPKRLAGDRVRPQPPFDSGHMSGVAILSPPRTHAAVQDSAKTR